MEVHRRKFSLRLVLPILRATTGNIGCYLVLSCILMPLSFLVNLVFGIVHLHFRPTMNYNRKCIIRLCELNLVNGGISVATGAMWQSHSHRLNGSFKVKRYVSQHFDVLSTFESGRSAALGVLIFIKLRGEDVFGR